MQKFLKLLITFSFLFVSCTNKKGTLNSRVQEYQNYFNAIQENEIFLYESENYSISAELVDKGNNVYSYYIFIDNPKIAMYDIKVLAVEKDSSFNSNKMEASIGIFENQKYSMIPFQVNADEGYYKGLMLSGETNMNQPEFEMLVNWYSFDRQNTYREFITFTLDKTGIKLSHDDME